MKTIRMVSIAPPYRSTEPQDAQRVDDVSSGPPDTEGVDHHATLPSRDVTRLFRYAHPSTSLVRYHALPAQVSGGPIQREGDGVVAWELAPVRRDADAEHVLLGIRGVARRGRGNATGATGLGAGRPPGEGGEPRPASLRVASSVVIRRAVSELRAA